jgi:hypothetical protein
MRFVKCFCGPHEPPVSAPARQAADYSPPEREQMQRAFAPIAGSYRRQKPVAVGCISGMALCLLLMQLVPRFLSPWLLVPAAVCFVSALVAGLSAPDLICPSCQNELEHDLGAYCPECGSRNLQAGGWERSPDYTWFREPSCNACRRMLLRSKRLTQRRLYKVRACTHCGLMLDVRGL